MTTTQERMAALHVTRVLICILGSMAILLDNVIGQSLGVVSLIAWLWMPNLISLELKLVEALHKKIEKCKSNKEWFHIHEDI